MHPMLDLPIVCCHSMRNPPIFKHPIILSRNVQIKVLHVSEKVLLVTVKVLHVTVKVLHVTVKVLHVTVKVLRVTVKVLRVTVKVLHVTVKVLYVPLVAGALCAIPMAMVSSCILAQQMIPSSWHLSGVAWVLLTGAMHDTLVFQVSLNWTSIRSTLKMPLANTDSEVKRDFLKFG
eukprot:scaffold169960_cov20-Tisochrysis_lutea.AAC.1